MENLRDMSFDNGGRVKGNTYRMLLKVVDRCCSTPDQHVLVIVTQPAAMSVMQMARTMLAPLGSFATCAFSQRKIQLENGSRITFIVAGNDTITRSMAGMRITDWAMDNSVERMDPVLVDYLRTVVRVSRIESKRK